MLCTECPKEVKEKCDKQYLQGLAGTMNWKCYYDKTTTLKNKQSDKNIEQEEK